MHVLLADRLAPLAAAGLTQAGHRVVEVSGLQGPALTLALEAEQPDVLVVRSTRVQAEHLHASRNLSLVVRAGSGVNTIDVKEAGRLGIFVANCPGRNAAAVAELTLGLMLAIDRQIPENVTASREGRWAKSVFSHALGLDGRTLGVIGLGPVGRAVVMRAHGLGMRIVAWSRSLTAAEAGSLGIERAESPLEVAAKSDVLTIHTALVPETRGLIGREVLSALRPGAMLINTARAEIVDESALLEAIESRDLRAGLDVLMDEPKADGPFTSPLASHPRVWMTHHIGASTTQAQEAVAQEVVRIVRSFEATGRPPAAVNLCATSLATHCLVVRHRDQVGVLADVLDRVRSAGINVAEMENTLFTGQEAAIARIRTHGDPSVLLAELNKLDAILHASVVVLPTGGPR